MDDDKLIGMEKQAAIDLCLAEGLKARVVAEDGATFMRTCDYLSNRRNLSVKNGKIISVSRG
jgi:hypothetical protein